MKPVLFLRALRRSRHLTQEALGELSGVAQNTISKLETHAMMPSFTTVVGLADALQVDPRQLRFGPEPGAPPRERRIEARPALPPSPRKKRREPPRDAAL